MNFLYPTFLWALAALSIPVIIHLFNFRRTRRVYFSNTRILRQVREVTTSKRRLKHYLILLSRLLFLFFLVIVFAQPIIPADEQMGSRRNVTLYLDNSLSMSAQLRDKSRAFDVGVSFVQNIVDLFPPDTRYRLITNDFSPFSNTFKTRAEVLDLLTQLRLSPVSRSANEIITKIQQENRAGEEEAFWISDFQQSTFGRMEDSRVDTSVRWHLVPVVPVVSDNIFIDSVYLDNPFAIGLEKNSLIVTVRNDGKKAVDQLNLKLSINDIQAATTSINVPAGGINETRFDITTGLAGLNRAYISFNDFPVSFDNDFFAAMNFASKINVLEIRSSRQVSSIQQVFGNRQVFNYNGYTVDNFNYSLLRQADLVVLNGIDVIDGSLSLALREYLNDFGTLLFIPGTRPEIQSYRSLLNVQVSTTDQAVMQELEPPDFNNPFFENVFEEKTTNLAMPSSRRILDWGGDRSAILHFKNGQPFLSSFQSGKLYLMASPLAEGYSDFFKSALFVPVMYRLAAGARKNVSQLYYTLKENFISLKVDSLVGEEPLRLVGQQEIIPSQRRIGDRVLLDIPKYALTEGFYHVVIRQDTVDLLAFNLNKEESFMSRYPVEEIQTMFGSGTQVTIFEADSAETFSNEIKARYLGKPLWKYALMLALFFFLVEILLIRFLK